MTDSKLYIVQSRVRGQWGDIVQYPLQADAERGLTALRKHCRDNPKTTRLVEGYRLVMREYSETVLDPAVEAGA